MTFDKKTLIIGTVISLLVAGGMLYLFRTEKMENPSLGIIYHEYRWGKAHELRADSNRDGAIDFRARYDGESRSFSTHDHPLEYWADGDYDGQFETHVVLSDSRIQRVELDENADGEYEKILTGKAAEDFYNERIFQDDSR